MKPLLLLSTLATVAAVEIDWTQVRPIEEFDHYWDRLTENLQILHHEQPSRRIINGNEAYAGQFPYHVVLISNLGGSTSLCGASVLSKNFILTAAHCVVGATRGAALLGAHNISTNHPMPQIIAFSHKDIAAHPGYSEDTFRNDVATVRMNNSIIFTDNVRPIRLPAFDDQRSFAGTYGTVAGYGRISSTNQAVSAVPRYITDSIITNARCLELWGNNRDIVSAQNMCLSGENSRTTSYGDSGGPLTISENGEALQVGIVSFVIPTCIGLPPGFTRVSYFRPWIVANSDYVSAAVHATKLSLIVLALFIILFVVL